MSVAGMAVRLALGLVLVQAPLGAMGQADGPSADVLNIEGAAVDDVQSRPIAQSVVVQVKAGRARARGRAPGGRFMAASAGPEGAIRQFSISAGCTEAIAQSCPQCHPGGLEGILSPLATCSDDCIDGGSAECANCRALQAQSCNRCRKEHAAALIEQGCQHLTCPLLETQLCPTCTSFGMSAACSACGTSVDTEECAQCAEESITCNECLDEMVDLLPSGCHFASTTAPVGLHLSSLPESEAQVMSSRRTAAMLAHSVFAMEVPPTPAVQPPQGADATIVKDVVSVWPDSEGGAVQRTTLSAEVTADVFEFGMAA